MSDCLKDEYWHFQGQRGSALLAAEGIGAALAVLIAHRQGEVLFGATKFSPAWAAHQRGHLERYMRTPHDPELPRRLQLYGAKIDRLLLKVCALTDSAWELARLPETQLIHAEAMLRREQARAARIEARRLREQIAEVERLVTAPHLKPKRAKRPVTPRCEKCGKRPRVTGRLCDPCAKWEAAR
jgi:hypothetical protein